MYSGFEKKNTFVAGRCRRGLFVVLLCSFLEFKVVCPFVYRTSEVLLSYSRFCRFLSCSCFSADPGWQCFSAVPACRRPPGDGPGLVPRLFVIPSGILIVRIVLLMFSSFNLSKFFCNMAERLVLGRGVEDAVKATTGVRA